MKTRWEYKVISGVDTNVECERELNLLGEDGWEAVGLFLGPVSYENWYVLLKRPK